MTARTLRFEVAATAVLALLTSLFVINLPSGKAWQRVSLDASHGPIFAAVAVVLGMWLASRVRDRDAAPWPDWARCGQAFALAVLIGIVVEFFQSLQARPPSLFDVLTDAAGAAAGLAAWSLFARPGTGRRGARDRSDEWAVTAIALAGLAFIAWRPVHAAVAYAGRAASFPVIAKFQGPRDLYFVSTGGRTAEVVDMPTPWAQRGGERALWLAWDAQDAPAVQNLEPNGDWRGYSVVALDLTNSSASELQLTLRIFDATHDGSPEDRLNLPLVIAPRTRTVMRVAMSAVESAPAGRPMDLSRVANVMLFGRKGEVPGELYLSRLWLE